MQRWTVRGVDTEAVDAIRAICAQTGASLGAILSEAIRHGHAAARRRFAPRAKYGPVQRNQLSTAKNQPNKS